MDRVEKVLRIGGSDLNYRLQKKDSNNESNGKKRNGKERSREFRNGYKKKQEESINSNDSTSNYKHTQFSHELNRDMQIKRLGLDNNNERE